MLPSVVFLRGSPRSGTTLLANVLGAVPEIGVFAEQPLGDVAQHLLPLFWYENAIEREHAAVANAGVARAVSSYEPLDTLQALRDRRPYPTRARLGAILTAVVEASLGKRDLRVIGSKTPGHWSSEQDDLVRSAFERVRCVFVVRNPLDTINSMVNRRNKARAGLDASWPDKPVSDAIARYQEAACLMLSCAARYPNESYVVGYEELLADAPRVLRALGAFLDVEIGDRGDLVHANASATNVLAPDEEAAVRAAFGRAIAGWGEKRLCCLAGELNGALDDCVRTVEPGSTYRCDAPAGDRGLLGTGWSGARAEGIWSDAPHPELWFAVPRDGTYAVELSVRIGRRGKRWRYAPERLAAGRAHRVTLPFGQTRVCLRRVRVQLVGP